MILNSLLDINLHTSYFETLTLPRLMICYDTISQPTLRERSKIIQRMPASVWFYRKIDKDFLISSEYSKRVIQSMMGTK